MPVTTRRRRRHRQDESIPPPPRNDDLADCVLVEDTSGKPPESSSLTQWASTLTARRPFFFAIGLLFGAALFYALSDLDARQRLLLVSELRHVVGQRLGEFGDSLSSSDSASSLANAHGHGAHLAEDLLRNITRMIADSLPSDENSAPATLLMSASHLKVAAYYPIVILPGIVASNLESWARGGCAESYFRKKIWGDLSMGTNLLLDKTCWLHQLKLDPVTGLDAEGTRVRAVMGIDAADFFVPGYWVFAKIIENLAAIGYDSGNVHMASFDWRLSLADLERRDHFFSKLKAHLELSKRITGRKTVAIVHSMGGNVWFYFMKWVESKKNGFRRGWVNEHIHAVVSIAAPFLGVPKSVPSFLSGEMRDTAQLGWFMAKVLDQVLTRKERAELFRSWGGGMCMLPKGGESIWGNRTWAPDHPDFMQDVSRSFGSLINFKEAERASFRTTRGYDPPEISADNVFQLIFNYTNVHFKNRTLMEHSHGIGLDDLASDRYDLPKYWVNPLEAALPHAPNMTFYNFYGIGKLTERAYYYSFKEDVQSITLSESNVFNHSEVKVDRIKLHIDTDMHDPQTYLSHGVQDTDGDGTVPLMSLGFMAARGWRWPKSTKEAREIMDKNGYGHIYNPGRARIVLREYKHRPTSTFKDMRGGPETGDHVDILGNHGLMLDLLKIVSNNAENITDRIYSDIIKYASRVNLQDRYI